jgi:DNA-binding HxlR family transcriptional regulator
MIEDRTARQRQVLSLLRESGPMTTPEMRRELPLMNESTLHTCLHTLRRRGLVNVEMTETHGPRRIQLFSATNYLKIAN